MAITYEPIETKVLGSAAAIVTFNSIPGTYTDLVLITNLKSSATPTAYAPTMYFNSDTSKTNYSFTALYGDGSGVSGAVTFRWTTSTSTQHGVMATAVSASNFNTGIINIQNYANTTTNKTVLTRTSDPANVTYTTVGQWLNTAAITTISLYAADGNKDFTTGSTFTLYGIKAA
jgi:hypothetical protein